MSFSSDVRDEVLEIFEEAQQTVVNASAEYLARRAEIERTQALEHSATYRAKVRLDAAFLVKRRAQQKQYRKRVNKDPERRARKLMMRNAWYAGKKAKP